MRDHGRSASSGSARSAGRVCRAPRRRHARVSRLAGRQRPRPRSARGASSKSLRSSRPCSSLDELIAAVRHRGRGVDPGAPARRDRAAGARGRHVTSSCCRAAGSSGVRTGWTSRAANGCRISRPVGGDRGARRRQGRAGSARSTSVTMETRKPPRGLAGAPWIESSRRSTSTRSRAETLIFEGTGRGAPAGRSRRTSTWWPRCRWPASAPSRRESASSPSPGCR